MKITINGEAKTLRPNELTVSQLLGELGLAQRRVAVEQNRKIVPRREHGTTQVREGDVLELVSFVGGG